MSKTFEHSSSVMIIKKTDSHNGFVGIVRSTTPAKYDIELIVGGIPRTLLINKSWVKKYADDEVKVLKGEYKNMKGKIVKRYDGEVVVNIAATGQDKKYKTKDVFYMDLLLKNNNYFQVSEILEDKLRGYENDKIKIVQKVIKMSDVKEMMPGFKMEKVNEINKDNGEDDMLADEIDKFFAEEEKDMEEKDMEEKDIEEKEFDYEEEPEEEMEDMKVSFADIERSAYENVKLTSDQMEYEKYIKQIVGDVELVNKFDIFKKVDAIMNEIVKPGNIYVSGNEKDGLAKHNDDKQRNLKYIISCLVFYDMNQSRGVTYDEFFNKIVPKSYFNMNASLDDISQTIFLINDVPKMLNITGKEEEKLNEWFDEGNVKEVIKFTIWRCDQNLRRILNVYINETGKSDMQAVKDIKRKPVSVPKLISESEKYKSVKEDEMINKVKKMEDTIKRLGDPKGKLAEEVKKIKRIIFTKRCKNKFIDHFNNEKDEKRKIIWDFLYNNFDNAEKVLNELKLSTSSEDQAKYKALLSTYNSCNRQFDEYMKKKEEEDIVSKMGQLSLKK